MNNSDSFLSPRPLVMSPINSWFHNSLFASSPSPQAALNDERSRSDSPHSIAHFGQASLSPSPQDLPVLYATTPLIDRIKQLLSKINAFESTPTSLDKHKTLLKNRKFRNIKTSLHKIIEMFFKIHKTSFLFKLNKYTAIHFGITDQNVRKQDVHEYAMLEVKTLVNELLLSINQKREDEEKQMLFQDTVSLADELQQRLNKYDSAPQGKPHKKEYFRKALKTTISLFETLTINLDNRPIPAGINHFTRIHLNLDSRGLREELSDATPQELQQLIDEVKALDKPI